MDVIIEIVAQHSAIAGFLVALLCLVGMFPAARRRRQLASAPLVKAKGAFVGLVQIEGLVRCDGPVRSYLAEAVVAHYIFDIQERSTRTVTSTTTDAQGRSRTTTRQETTWTSVARGGETRLFDVEDETGRVQVRAEGATIDAPTLFDETVRQGDPIYYGKGPPGAVSNSDGIRRFVEHGYVIGAPVYVCGTARERDDLAELEIAKGELDTLFLIDKDGHESVTKGFGWRSTGFLITAFVALGGGIYALQEKPWFVQESSLCGIAFLSVWVVGAAVTISNGLKGIEARVEQARSNLDVHLKRRYDLIPRLAESARGYAAHEGDLREHLARPGGALAVAEAYPALATQPVFLKLQRELADTEERVALARGYLAAAEALRAAAGERFPESLFVQKSAS